METAQPEHVLFFGFFFVDLDRYLFPFRDVYHPVDYSWQFLNAETQSLLYLNV